MDDDVCRGYCGESRVQCVEEASFTLAKNPLISMVTV